MNRHISGFDKKEASKIENAKNQDSPYTFPDFLKSHNLPPLNSEKYCIYEWLSSQPGLELFNNCLEFDK